MALDVIDKSMAANQPTSKGLIQPHIHYSFLQTTSEGLSQNESDSESLAQEIDYQLELQERIHKMEKMVYQSGGELEEDSLEENSLEEDSLEEQGLEDDGGGLDMEEMQIPSGSIGGKENCSSASREEGMDRYMERRYNRNWKKDEERDSSAELEDSHWEDEDSSPILSFDQIHERAQNRSPSFDRESSHSCDLATRANKGSSRPSNNKEEEVVCRYNQSPSVHGEVKEHKPRPEKDFVEKNKLTLGLATPPSNPYLQRHGKKQRKNRPGQVYLSKKLRMGRTSPSQAGSLQSQRSPVQHPLGDQAELRGQRDGHHNVLEFENAHAGSSSYREVSDLEPDSRLLLHQSLYPNPSLAHILMEDPSPTAHLIQLAEQHHREISQLADAHLTGSQFSSMFPHIVKRWESDSRLNTESCNESQPGLSRSNSESHLLQMGKQKKMKEKENRKGSRTKGYMKMDVKLGGLGADYETIKEKNEKMKQEKEYAKQVKEHNLRKITSARKPVAKPENKSSVSRKKALEYAKTVPKPKVYVPRPSEPEPKDERILAQTLSGETLPPISTLESLQNRHEKEKEVVAAFKALHIG